MARIDSAVSSSQVYADGESSSARYTRTLSGARSALFTLLIAIALVFTVEVIVRWSWPDTVAYFADPMRPAWTTVAVFFLAMLGVDALFGREHKAALLIAPLAVVPAFISQQKQVFLSDPLYPTDFLSAGRSWN